ncbi:sulfur carrier protein ThiS [Bacillus sp. OAE603]|uniref:sulfur carrier protein ThiS n=1 Tax=Gottfriedia sp. OAE603 TaxID=2663872 RepID=UPI00178A823C
MIIQLNGKSIQLAENIFTVKDLLLSYQLENRIVVVEVNKEILYRELYGTTALSNGDIVELIHFVGGG